MKNLGNLTPAAGSHRTDKRKGRGPGSGLGKTAGRGHKGQRAHKSGNAPRGFEGGQMPLFRRSPKRGFTSLDRVEYTVINLDRLTKVTKGTRVTPEFLKEQGIVRSLEKPVKLLGRGTIDFPLTIVLHKVSEAAREAVVKAGGAVEEMAE